MPDLDLRTVLETLDPSAREHLRDVLIHDHADRDAIASMLMRYRDQNGRGWADIIDLLTMYPGLDGESYERWRKWMLHNGPSDRVGGLGLAFSMRLDPVRDSRHERMAYGSILREEGPS
jgi:hypothetical protein